MEIDYHQQVVVVIISSSLSYLKGKGVVIGMINVVNVTDKVHGTSTRGVVLSLQLYVHV